MTETNLLVSLLSIAVVLIVGLLAACLKLWLSNRKDNPGLLSPAAKTAIENVKRDISDVNAEMCQFHRRLERHMEIATQGQNKVILLLSGIERILKDRLPLRGS